MIQDMITSAAEAVVSRKVPGERSSMIESPNGGTSMEVGVIFTEGFDNSKCMKSDPFAALKSFNQILEWVKVVFTPHLYN